MDSENGDKRADGAGYRRPPNASRWKKGQCGNPHRKRALKGAAEIIDQLFAKPVDVVENGSARTANGLEIIVTQLVRKEMAGDRRAMAVRLKYAAFAVRQKVSRDILITSDQSDRRREMAKRAKAEEDRN
jgi:hypothetical protein